MADIGRIARFAPHKGVTLTRAVLRRLAVVAATLAIFTAMAPAALAAAPSNDVFTGATLVAVGFSETLDTTEATTDADDAQVNTDCGAPATDASVWYAIDGTDSGVIVDVSPSDYTAGVIVGTGTQGNLGLVTCGPGAVAFFAEAGTTYFVLAFDDQFDGAGNGGLLSISFNEIPPPPTVDITINRIGTVNARTGIATISGTVTCTNGEFIDVFVNARQSVGRFVVTGDGFFFDFGTCDGDPRDWSVEVVPFNGKFAGGRAMTVAFGFSCGLFECSDGFAEQTVMLRGRN